ASADHGERRIDVSQGLGARARDQREHRALVREAHLALSGVDVGVEASGRHGEPQRARREAPAGKQVPVRAAQRLGERRALDPAPVDDEDLSFAGRASVLGQAEERLDPHPVPLSQGVQELGRVTRSPQGARPLPVIVQPRCAPAILRRAAAHWERRPGQAFAPVDRQPDPHLGRRTRPTAAMLGRAAPRNPSEPRRSRSSRVAILLVAWRSRASSRSPAAIPVPSSATWKAWSSERSTWTAIERAPASSAFSRISLSAESGRSITSPAAMRDAVSGASRRIERVNEASGSRRPKLYTTGRARVKKPRFRAGSATRRRSG